MTGVTGVTTALHPSTAHILLQLLVTYSKYSSYPIQLLSGYPIQVIQLPNPVTLVTNFSYPTRLLQSPNPVTPLT